MRQKVAEKEAAENDVYRNAGLKFMDGLFAIVLCRET